MAAAQSIADRSSWWSRAWSVVAFTAFAVHLGAAVYEAAVLAPIWTADPPASVRAWAALKLRPDSSSLFHPLVAVIVVSTSMAWLSGLLSRGWRRAWLTLALLAAAALAAATVLLVLPAERALFGAASPDDAAASIAWTGEWIRAAALRFAALFVGCWTLYRAQIAAMVGRAMAARAGYDSDEDFAPEGAAPGRRAREFSFGDEHEPELSLGDDAGNPRQRWRGSLGNRRRTAKK